MSLKRNPSKSPEGPSKEKYPRDDTPNTQQLIEENEALTNEYLRLYENYDRNREDLVQLADYIDCIDMNTYLINACVSDLQDRLYYVQQENFSSGLTPPETVAESSPEAEPSEIDVESSPEAEPSEIEVETSPEARPSEIDVETSQRKGDQIDDSQLALRQRLSDIYKSRKKKHIIQCEKYASRYFELCAKDAEIFSDSGSSSDVHMSPVAGSSSDVHMSPVAGPSKSDDHMSPQKSPSKDAQMSPVAGPSRSVVHVDMSPQKSPSKDAQMSPQKSPSKDAQMSPQKSPSKDAQMSPVAGPSRSVVHVDVSSLKSLSKEDAQAIKESVVFCQEMMVEEMKLIRRTEILKSAIDKYMPKSERPVKINLSTDAQAPTGEDAAEKSYEEKSYAEKIQGCLKEQTHQRKSGRKKKSPKKFEEAGPSKHVSRRRLRDENEALKLHNTQMSIVVSEQDKLLEKFQLMRTSKRTILDLLFKFAFLAIKDLMKLEDTRERGDREDDWGDREENRKLLEDIKNVLDEMTKNAEKTVIYDNIGARFCFKVMVLRIRNVSVLDTSDAQRRRNKMIEEKRKSGKEIAPQDTVLQTYPRRKKINKTLLERIRMKIQLSELLENIQMPQKLSLRNNAEIEVEEEKQTEILREKDLDVGDDTKKLDEGKENVEKDKHPSDDITDIQQLIKVNEKLKEDYRHVNKSYATKRKNIVKTANEIDCMGVNGNFAIQVADLLQRRYSILMTNDTSTQEGPSEEDAQMAPVAGPSRSDVHMSPQRSPSKDAQMYPVAGTSRSDVHMSPQKSSSEDDHQKGDKSRSVKLYLRTRKCEPEMECDIEELEVAVEKHIPVLETSEDSSSSNVQDTCTSQPADKSKLKEENESLKYYNERLREILEILDEVFQILQVMWLAKHRLARSLLKSADQSIDSLIDLEKRRKKTKSEINRDVEKTAVAFLENLKRTLLSMRCNVEHVLEGIRGANLYCILHQIEVHNFYARDEGRQQEFQIERVGSLRSLKEKLEEGKGGEVSEVCENDYGAAEVVDRVTSEISEILENVHMPQRLSLERDAEIDVDEEKQAEHDKKDLDVAQDVGKSE